MYNLHDDNHSKSKKVMSENISNQKLRQIAVISIIGLLSAFLLFSLRNYVTALLGAIILYVLFRPVMHRLISKFHWKKSWATWIIILSSFLIVVIPVSGLIYLIISKMSQIFSENNSITHVMDLLDQKFSNTFHISLLTENNLMKLQENASQWVSSFVNGLLQTFTTIVIMYFLLYYLLINVDLNETIANRFSPFSKTNTKLLGDELRTMTYSNTIIVPMVAAGQGLIAACGYWIFGLDQPLFWGIMTGCFAVIPIVGSAIIWVPAVAYLFLTGETWQAVGLLIYCAVVVSLVDNVLRLTLQKRFANVHPVITVFGVIIGLNWFGIPGLIFGPLLISYFVLLLKIYRNEYLNIGNDHY